MSAGSRMSVATSAPRSHRGADSAGGPSMYRAIANAISALYDRMLRRADSRSNSSYGPGMRTFVLIEVPNPIFLGIDVLLAWAGVKKAPPPTMLQHSRHKIRQQSAPTRIDSGRPTVIRGSKSRSCATLTLAFAEFQDCRERLLCFYGLENDVPTAVIVDDASREELAF